MSLYAAFKRALREVISPLLDSPISTRASEATLQSVLSQLDITLTELRDAIRGAEAKTLTDLDTSILNLLNALKPTRTLPVQEISSQTITGGNYAEFIVDNSKADGFSALVVTTKATYNSGASAGVRVRWLYSPDGINFDTPEDAESAGNYDDLSFAAGQTRIKTTLIPLFQPYVKVQIVNQDPTYDVVVDVWRVLMR